MINVFRAVLGSSYLFVNTVCLFAISVTEGPLKTVLLKGHPPKIFKIIKILINNDNLPSFKY